MTSVSKIDFVGWLVLTVGVLVILYGLLMVALAMGWKPGGRDGDPALTDEPDENVPSMSP